MEASAARRRLRRFILLSYPLAGGGLTQIFALADDLTGALEVGAKFAGAAVTTRLAWDCRSDAMVIDTETRHAPPDAAAAVIRRLACAAHELRARFVFKKTDSTLRGNIGVELSALAQAF